MLFPDGYSERAAQSKHCAQLDISSQEKRWQTFKSSSLNWMLRYLTPSGSAELPKQLKLYLLLFILEEEFQAEAVSNMTNFLWQAHSGKALPHDLRCFAHSSVTCSHSLDPFYFLVVFFFFISCRMEAQTASCWSRTPSWSTLDSTPAWLRQPSTTLPPRPSWLWGVSHEWCNRSTHIHRVVWLYLKRRFLNHIPSRSIMILHNSATHC